MAKAKPRKPTKRKPKSKKPTGPQMLLAPLKRLSIPGVALVLAAAFAAGAGYKAMNWAFSDAPPGVEATVASEPHAATYEERLPDEVFVPVLPEHRNIASLPPATATSVPTWLINAVPFEAKADLPMIAIVIDDMGVDRSRSKRMWEDVPTPLTLSFLTYAEDIKTQTAAARGQGHELMLHIAMEPSSDAVDPGPNVLLTSMDADKIRSVMDWAMTRFDGYVGINNHMGSRFTEDAAGMRVVLERVKDEGVLFLDSRTSTKTVAGREAQLLGMASLDRNVFLDNVNEVPAVNAQLSKLEALAKKHGHAIAIGHPKDATIEALKVWMREAPGRGIQVVPISAIMLKHLRAGQG